MELQQRREWIERELQKLTPPERIPLEKKSLPRYTFEAVQPSRRPRRSHPGLKIFGAFLFLLCAVLALVYMGSASGGLSAFVQQFLGGNAITGAALGVQPVAEEAASLRIVVENSTVKWGQALHVTAWLTVSGTMTPLADAEVVYFLDEQEIGKAVTDADGKAEFSGEASGVEAGTYTLEVKAAGARDWALITVQESPAQEAVADEAGLVVLPATEEASVPEEALDLNATTEEPSGHVAILPAPEETPVANETASEINVPNTTIEIIPPANEPAGEPIAGQPSNETIPPNATGSSALTAGAVVLPEPAATNATTAPESQPPKLAVMNLGTSGLGIFTAPTLYSVVLNSTNVSTNHTNVNLTLYFNTTDTIAIQKNITTWTVNTTPFAIVNMPFERINNSDTDNAYDYSENKFYGVEQGCSGSCLPQWNSTGGFDGKGAYRFNSSNNLDLHDRSQFDFVTYKMNFTIMFWMKPVNDVRCERLVSKRESTTPFRGYMVALCGPTDNNLYFEVNKNGSGGTPFQQNIAFTLSNYLNTWTHVAVTWEDVDDTLNRTSMFINGARVSTTASGLGDSTNDNLTIGSATGLPFFNGTIDELLIFNRSLSYQQIENYFRNRTDWIHFNETKRNDVWKACVVPHNGTGEGSQTCSGSLTILNAAPTQGVPVLNATDHPLNRTDANLTAYNVSGADIDGDRIKSIFNWYRNGTSLTFVNMPFESVNNTANNNTWDYSGYGHNSSNYSTTTAWNASGGYDGLGAYEFDGSASDFITIGDRATFKALHGAADPDNFKFTAMFWVKFPNAEPDALYGLVATESGTTVDTGVSMFFDDRSSQSFSRRLRFAIMRGVSGQSVVNLNSADNVYPNNAAWHHLAFSYDQSLASNNANIYVDGDPVATGSKTGNAPSTGDSTYTLHLGSMGSGAFRMTGTPDELLIFNRSLSVEEIRAIYRNQSYIIVSNETTVNDVWQACVTPNDGLHDGGTVCSVNLTIRPNTKPVVDTIVLNSTNISSNNTNVNLTLYFNTTDANSDPIKNITSWYLNGTPFMVFNMPFEKINDTDTQNTWDYSGLRNNGTEQGGVVWNSTGGYDGKGAYKFDGVNDYIDAGQSETLNPNNNDFTIAVWVRYTGAFLSTNSVVATILDKGDDSQADGAYTLFLRGGSDYNGTGFRYRVSSGTAQDILISYNMTGNLSDGRWHHIAAVVDEGGSPEGRLYVDGNLSGTRTSFTLTINPDESLRLGTWLTGGTNQFFFTGDIDDVLIFNHSLSTEQIYLLYTNRTNIIALNETNKRQVWQACITPNDGIEDGSQVCSRNITILNAPAIADTVVLNTTDVTLNQTNQNLTLYFNTTDTIDNDAIKNITTWTVNSNPFAVITMPFERVNNTAADNAYDYSESHLYGVEQGCSGSCLPQWNSTGGFDGRGAYRFNGSQLIDLHDRPQLDFVTFKNNFTIMFWSKLEQTWSTCERLLSKREIASPYKGYAVAFCGADRRLYLMVAKNGSSSTFQSIQISSILSYNTWYHAAMTWEDVDDTLNRTTMYINGVRDSQGSGVLGTATNDNMTIGGASGSSQFNGTIDEFMIFNRSLSYQQIANYFRNTTHQINFNETQTNDLWRACVVPHDGDADGSQVCSNTVTILSDTANSRPTAPVTGNPFNGSAITNRTPIFEWFNASDADGDVISYHLQADDNPIFNNPEINVSAITDLSSAAPGNTTWYSTVTLDVDTRYYWRVRANDSGGFGSWSNGASADGPGANLNLSNFTIDSLLSVSVLNGLIEFGSLAPGAEQNTTDGVPPPFRFENAGNILFNISINGSRLFTAVSFPSSNYQYKARANSSESGAFNSSGSTTTFTNMNTTRSLADVAELNWRNAFDEVFIDINVSVPNDEPPGKKSSNVTFTITSSSLS